MARIRMALGSTVAWVLSLAWLSLLCVVYLWPASWWLEVRDVHVDDGAGEITMTVDRTIKRAFSASWFTTLRRWDGGGWVVYCNASGEGAYLPGARFPVPLTLKWWTVGQCSNLFSGKYVMTTAWTIHLPGLPDKIVSVDSNPWTVQ